jgi:CheY-like chemotaxis protein
MDVIMPNMDGIEATRYIRELSDSVPIVAVTAFAGTDRDADCFAAGMNTVLAKPLRRSALREILNKYCN